MIKKIAVLGAGTMGHGIAEAFAIHGYLVNLFETDTLKLNTVKDEIKLELEILLEEGFIQKGDVHTILNRITLFSDLEKAVKDRDFVIEAAPEKIEIKQQLFKEMDRYCPQHTILATNTSSLKLCDMMAYISEERKKRVLITHWYNPAHLIPIAELSFFGNMPIDIYDEVEQLYHSIGKQTVKVLKEVPGLVANRIQQGVAREVFSLIQNGVASPEDIDKALKFGPAFRYATTGQLEIADFGGLDIWCVVGDNLLSVMDNSKQSNTILREKINEGKLGVKSGEGFFTYDESEVNEIKRSYIKKLIHQLKASEYYI